MSKRNTAHDHYGATRHDTPAPRPEMEGQLALDDIDPGHDQTDSGADDGRS